MSKPDKYLVVDHVWSNYDDDWAIDDAIQSQMNKLDVEGYEVRQIEELCIRSRLLKLQTIRGQVVYNEHSLGNEDVFEHERCTRVYYQRK